MSPMERAAEPVRRFQMPSLDAVRIADRHARVDRPNQCQL